MRIRIATFRESLQARALLSGKTRGHLHVNFHMQVADAATVHFGHALPAQTENFIGWGPRRNLKESVAFQRWDLDLTPKRGARKADRHIAK